MRKAIYLVAACAFLLSISLWLAKRHPQPGNPGTDSAPTAIARPAPAAPTPSAPHPVGPANAVLASATPQPGAEIITRFAEWTRQYLEAAPAERTTLLNEGIELARQRRSVFKQRIIEDPRRALEEAVPMVVRQQLPASVLALLEARLNDVAVLRVLQGVPLPGEPLPVKSLTFREAEFKDGKTYRAYVYGRRAEKIEWTPGASLNGVALDADFAVSDNPSRTLEAGEIPNPRKPAVTICPVSGETTPALAAGEPVTEQTPAVETATEIVHFCGPIHINLYNETLIMGEGVSGGAFGFTGILPAAPTPALGIVKVLAIPMTYADQNGVPATEATLYATLRDVGNFYAKASFGRLTLVGVVTPPVKLPHNEAWYVNRDTSNGGDISGTSVEHNHARAEARMMGFDSTDYDCIVVRHTGGPGSYGGLGGGASVWARSDSASLWAHEIGHCFALAHSNFWDTAGTSAIGAGTNQEYGDSYDNMGGSPFPAGQYNAQAKSQIKWMPSNFVRSATQSGLYRIYAFDQGVLLPDRNYALTIVKDAQKTYWGEVRALFDTNPWAKNGLLLGWRYPSGSGSNLQRIDTTPGSPFLKEDAAISLGGTFSDTESGIHMTTVAASDSPRYVDVVVNFGQFPGNQKPTLALAASTDVVPTGATVTFTASAGDPDGDSLAYSWQHFGDTTVKLVSGNTPVITRTFTTAGTYVVSCTVSDMKGGSVTRNQLITVGNGNSRFTISGRVTLLGAGLQDVVITANGANGVVTDADGYYTIPNLTTNTYTMTPLLYGFTFGELFNNSVVVGPNAGGANFEAAAAPVVTLAATVPGAKELVPVTAGRFTLTRTGDISQDLVVNANTVQGSATKTTDYTFAPDYVAGSQGFSTFTILADSATLDITVTPVSDSAQEGPETVILQLGPGNGYLVGAQSSAMVVIDDDDTALPKVSIAATTLSTIENAGAPAVLTFTRTGATTGNLTVNYTVGGSAASVADFTALSGSVIIPTGAASAVVHVAPVNDAVSEPLETVKLTTTSNAAYLIDPLAANATVNLIDDDVQTVTVTATDNTAQEVDLSVGGAVADTGTFVVARSGDLTNPLTVYYSISGTPGSGVPALHGVDFEALPGVLVIPAGAAQSSVTIIPRYETLGEGPESVVLSLGAGSTNYVLGSPNAATVTIADGAGNVPYVDVVNTTSASEPSTNGNFHITTRGGSGTGTLMVNYTISGTATAGVDFTALSGSVAITLANGATVTTNIAVAPLPDTEFEDLESITLTITPNAAYQTYATTSATTMWLRDNEQPTVYVDTQVGTSGSSTITEGGTGVIKFYVSRTGSTASALTVNYATGGTATAGSDYTALPGSVTIPAGSLGADVPVVITNDTTFEGTETIALDFAAGSYSTGPGAVMYIADNDTATNTVAFQEVSSSGSESVTTVNIPVTLSPGSASTVSVEYSVSASTTSATPTTVASQTLPKWFKLERAGNTFSTSYSSNGTAWTTLGTPQVIAPGPTTLAGLAVSAKSDGNITTATFDNVSITPAPAGAMQGRSVGFVNAEGSENFSGGVWTVTGSGAGIGGTNDEAHFVAAEVSGDFTLIARVVTITGGATNAQAGVMMRHDRTHYSRQIYSGFIATGSVERQARLQSATTAFGSGVDFICPPGVLTFDPGETTKNISFTVIDDSVREPNNLMTLQLSNASGAAISSAGTYHGYTIIDNDTGSPQPFVGFAAAASSVSEAAGTHALLVSLSSPATAPVTVDYAVTAGASSDFDLPAGAVTFAAGETVKTIAVTINQDSDVEPGENATVTLTNPTGSQLGSLSTHTFTILDDDFPAVSIAATDADAAENGDTGTFTITRAGSLAGSLTVNFTRSGTAVSGTDYAAIATPGSVIIPDGQPGATVTVTPNQDTTNEGSETVILTLTANAAYTLGAPSAATVTIADDDRSTVTLVANDADASETAGNPGQFTVTRTAPTTGSLTVTVAISGTASNTTDYAAVPTSVAFTAGQSARTINITPADDAVTEGPEQVTISLASGSYNIGAQAYDNVTIADNDSPPTLFISNPTAQGSLVANGNGVILTASVIDDGAPQPVALTWSQAAGPGTATIESPSSETTAVTFSAAGTYVLRVSASDGQFIVSDQATVVVGSSIVAADWFTQDLGPSSARRGQGLQFGNLFTVSGTGAGYTGTTDQAHVMVRPVDGDSSIVARITDLQGTGSPLTGVTLRDAFARGARRAVLGYSGGSLQFRTRTTVSATDTFVTQAGVTLPVWVKLERNATTGEITASYAPDVSGSAGAWAAIGTPTVVTMDSRALAGLFTTSNSTASLATAVIDNVTLTPAPSGPALIGEDSGVSPTAPGSGSVASGTYTIAGSTSGYYHGWQYYGDLMITARLAATTSGAGSAKSGIRIAESMEAGAYAHMGRIPTGSYSGYVWTSIAGGSGGGVPSGVANGNWIRIIRKGNSITGFRASDVAGSPGTWAQIGQPQTVIMTTPVFVGFWVDNASGVGLNTATFSNLSIVPLNKAPVVSAGTVASNSISPVNLAGSVTDDDYPSPPSLAVEWSAQSGPASVSFGNAASPATTATFATPGVYRLRLTGDDTSAVTFQDLTFNGYTSPYDIWTAQQFGPNWTNPAYASLTSDLDFDDLNNLSEYGQAMNPNVPNASPILVDIEQVVSLKYLRLTTPKNPAATDLQYVVEATGTLDVPASWSSAGLVIEVNTSSQLVVRDGVPITPGIQRFMRLRMFKP